MNLKKSYLIIGIVVILIAILGCICLSYLTTEYNPGEKTTIEVYDDGFIDMGVFINEIKNHPSFEGYNNDTLAWLESLGQNYIVFSSNESYYIMSPYDANKLPREFVTDVTITDICDCTIVDQKPLGNNLRNVVLVKNVDFVGQTFQYYDV